MQPNNITIATDVLNNGTTENHVFERVRQEGLKSTYHGPSHTDALRNTLAFLTNDPKASGNFPGVRKSDAKRTMDVSVVGVNGENIVAPAIVEIKCSFPVGTPIATQLMLRQECLNLLDQDAIMEPLNNRGVI